MIKSIILNLKDYQYDQHRLGFITAAVLAISSYTLYRQWWIVKKEQNDNCPIVPYSNPLLGSTHEYLQDTQAFLQKWSVLGPVYQVHLYGKICTVVSSTYVHEIGRNNNFTRVEGTYREFYLQQWTGVSKDDFSMSDVRDVIHEYLAVKLKNYSSRIEEYSNIGLNEALGTLTGPKEISDLQPIFEHVVVKVAASIFAGVDLCKDEKLIEVFKYFGPCIGLARSSKTWVHCIPQVFLNIHMWYIGKFDPYITKCRVQLMNTMKPEIDRRLQRMAGNNSTWERPNDILQDLLEKYPLPTASQKDIYTYYAGWMTWLFFPSIAPVNELISSVLHRLLQYPEVLNELISEQSEVIGDFYSKNGNKECFTVETVRKLVKLDSVCRESFRANKEFTATDRTNVGRENVILSNGISIPPGQDVLLNSWINHQDNKLQKDSMGGYENFKPFRHLETNHRVTKTGDDFMLFGVGKHVCPARWFTMHLVKTIISLLIRDYNITSVEEDLAKLSNSSAGKVIIERKQT